MNSDDNLSLSEKLELIQGIKHWQKVRWRRLKYWRNLTNMPLRNKHLFMNVEIRLIREQAKRLNILEQQVFQ